MTKPATEVVKLTDRINRIEPAATMVVVAEADELCSQGIDVVDFGAGEPHFTTPPHIKEAAVAAIQSNSRRISSTHSCGPLNAATAAFCAIEVGFDVDLLCSFAMALVTVEGASA